MPELSQLEVFTDLSGHPASVQFLPTCPRLTAGRQVVLEIGKSARLCGKETETKVRRRGLNEFGEFFLIEQKDKRSYMKGRE